MKKLQLSILMMIVLLLFTTCGSTSEVSEGNNNTETENQNSEASTYYIIESFTSSNMNVGSKFPELTWKDEDGNLVSLYNLGASAYLIDIWATWCGPCRQEIPHLNEMHDKFGPEGLIVLGISVDDNPNLLPPFIESQGIKYLTLQTSDNNLVNTILSKGGGAIPQTFVLDRNSEIHQSFLGYSPAIGSEMEKSIEEVIE